MINLYDYAVEKVYENVAGPKERQRDQLNFRCFYCGDSQKSKFKKRAHIYRGQDNGVSFYCWNCRRSSRGYQLISDLTGMPVREIMKEVLQEHRHMSGKSMMSHILDAEPVEPVQSVSAKIEETYDTEIHLKSTWVDLTKNEDAVKIIIERMIHKAPFLPKNYDLYYDTESKRIVIPWYHRNKLTYYQMRKIYGNSDRKYMFPTKAEIPHKGLYGLDEITDDCPYVFYTEGVFDAIFIINCIAVGGLMPTDYQRGLLEPYLFDKQLVLFPDNPWLDKTSRDNLVKLGSNHPYTLVYMWPKDCECKDVNELVLKTNNPNIFANLSDFEDRVIPASKCKLMLLFGKDNL